ncbi:MAG: hypothetical protein AB7O97_09565 [Planctomycetota bacterium]
MIRAARPYITLLATALLVGAAHAQLPSYRTASDPSRDAALGGLPGGVMLSMPGISTDMVLSGGGQFVELPDGTARVTARVRSLSRIYAGLLIDIAFSGRVDPGDAGWPPPGAPDLQLAGSAYAPIGPVDAASFHFYTQASGVLHGVRELDGAHVTLQLQPGTAAQVGAGANNRNGLLGVSARFDVTVLANPFPPTTPFGATGTGEFACTLVANRSLSTTHCMIDTGRSPLPSDRAMVLPGLPGEYLFVPAASMVEYTDGHAELRGTLARIDQLNDKWDLVLNLTDRRDPGEVDCPPTGAPDLGLYPAQYAAQGGPIDPTHWHYYAAATGTLTGRGDNDGGLITLVQSAPLQVGGGANQANTYFGAFGRFATSLVSQPASRVVALNGADATLHVLTGNFPVLPLPYLVVPPSTPQLDAVTDQGFVIEGDHLAWLTAVGVGPDYLTSKSETQWYRGYFKILDNQHIEVHPAPGHAPGTYSLRGFNPAINTNAVTVQLNAPASPTLRIEPTLRVGSTQHVFVHDGGGTTGPVLSVLCVSSDLVPSVQPGFVSLAIGDAFQTLVVFDQTFAHDPASGAATLSFGPVPASVVGMTSHYQAVVLDLGGGAFPLPVTNTWTVTYTP